MLQKLYLNKVDRFLIILIEFIFILDTYACLLLLFIYKKGIIAEMIKISGHKD